MSANVTVRVVVVASCLSCRGCLINDVALADDAVGIAYNDEVDVAK